MYTIDDLIKERARELKSTTSVGYPKIGVTYYEEHSAQDLDDYADAAAAALRQRGLQPVDASLERAPVVGLLAHSSFHYIVTVLGLTRLGYAILLLSTRLASPGLKRLLELTDCDTLLTTDAFRQTIEEVQKERKVATLDFVEEHEYRNVSAEQLKRKFDKQKEHSKVAIIIHSSGSTGLPKPIYLTHRSCLGAFSTHLGMRGLHTSPLFHSHAFYELFRSIYAGKPMHFWNYSMPFTKDDLIAMIEHVKPEVFHCVPYILKLLAESDHGVEVLATAKIVQYGGSACPDDLGDRLVRAGVVLVGNYGATETGRVMNSVRPADDYDWNYMRVLPSVKEYVLMDEIAPNLFECVALSGLRSKSTTNSDDPPDSFRTRDLFEAHPTRPGLWKYVSRLDDRFTLTMGEKVLPILMEGRVRQEALVQEVCVFGEGRSVPGLLIIKAERAEKLSDEDFVEQVWPAVQEANSRAEAFARIPRELVVVLPAGTDYPKTDKGTFTRAKMYTQFADHIDNAYAKFERNDKGGDLDLSGPELEAWLVKQFKTYLDTDVEANTDFFSVGIDSLMCIKMWNLIKRRVDLGGNQNRLGQNVLYETGNVNGLARHLEDLRRGEVGRDGDVERVLQGLIEKYSKFEPIDQQTRTISQEGDVVLLTGVTGGLGAHLLVQLLSTANISHVYCFVRASSDEEAFQRVQQSLDARSLSLTPPQSQKITALSSDLGKPDFALTPTKLQELKSRLTICIHSAWAVNFNVSVQSFEAQHISGVYNLLSLCHTTSAKFFFCSSVSVAGGTPRPGTVPEAPIADVKNVQGTGYARSKYVAEWVTVNAARKYGINARVLRVGQLIGDTRVGEWNVSEGVPMLIRTARTIGALPTLDEEMSWLPIDYAATIILDLSQSTTKDPDLVYHVLNPKLFHWTRDMLPALAASGLTFETVPTDEWMQKLRSSDQDPKKNPPIKLMGWFESKYGGRKVMNKGVLEFETGRAAGDSETLAEKLPSVTEAGFVRMFVERMMGHWDEEAR